MSDSLFTTKELLLELRGDVKDIGGKVDRIDRQGAIIEQALLNTNERLDVTDGRVEKLEDAVGKIGDFKNRALGAYALVAFLVPIVVALLYIVFH